MMRPPGDDLGPAAAQGTDQRRGPGVLVDHEDGDPSVLEDLAGLVDVVPVDQPRPRALEHREVEVLVRVDLGDRQGR